MEIVLPFFQPTIFFNTVTVILFNYLQVRVRNTLVVGSYAISIGPPVGTLLLLVRIRNALAFFRVRNFNWSTTL